MRWIVVCTLLTLPAAAQERAFREELAARRAALAQNGGTKESEAAVDAALRWLAAHQSPDGSWSPTGWRALCAEKPCGGGRAEEGEEPYREGLTGLALLPFLARGIGPDDPTHGHIVARALAWLQRLPPPAKRVEYDQQAYNLALSAAALSEAAALTGDERVKAAARVALAWCAEAQNPSLGWKYGVRSGRNDTSVTLVMVHAFYAAERAGIEFELDAVYGGAMNWFVRATDSEGNVGYETPGGGSSVFPSVDGKFDELPVMTGAGLFGRLAIGERRSEDALRKGVVLLMAAPPEWSERRVNFYHWLWGTYAMEQVGGDKWAEWNRALHEAVLPRQRQDGCAGGSWNPDDPWCSAGGRVYATAAVALALEAPYRLPAFQARDVHDEARQRRAAAEGRKALAADLEAAKAQLLVATDARAARGDRHKALAAVARALTDKREELRDQVGAAVITGLDAARVDTLLDDLRGAPRNTKRDALRVAALLSGHGQRVLDRIVAALSDKDMVVRTAAAEALGRWGPAAASAAPALEKLLSDPEWAVQNAARRALESLREE